MRRKLKVVYRTIGILAVIGLMVYIAVLLEGMKYNSSEHVKLIEEWEVVFTDQFDPGMSMAELEALGGWVKTSDLIQPTKKNENGVYTQWIRIKLPPIEAKTPAILIDQLYGRNIVGIINGNVIFESSRNYNYPVNSILIPINKIDSNGTLYIGLDKLNKKIGIANSVKVGDIQYLNESMVKQNFTDYILGCSLIFIAIIMIICYLFLQTINISVWLSLSIVIFSSGVIVLTNSPFSYWLFNSNGFGHVISILFDLALFTALPAFTLFFERVFGSGYRFIVTKFRKFQVWYSLFCILVLIINEVSKNALLEIYVFVTVTILAFIMIVQFLLLFISSLYYIFKGNKDVLIFSGGLLIFVGFSVGELVWFLFNSFEYDLFLYKWGIVGFLVSLIVILGRKFVENHLRVVEYSKKLEKFNNEIQFSEKMEMISQLAASVAHEVRNPLQVTRGFIQLMSDNDISKDKMYYSMAMEELDRASYIITDFLSFAKPESEDIVKLHVSHEFIHIQGILIPMANLKGGTISVDIPKGLYIIGNSSKLKQAFINIIKNSIEAMKGEGIINIWGYHKRGHVYIHVKDNGEGMDEEALKRLGEAYYTNKEQGTGLGLLVTFRIIESMQGTLTYKSKKGEGTEAIIKIPSAK